MNRSSSRALMTLVVIVTLIPTVAWSETARDRARNHAQQGRLLYEEGRYQEALEEYQEAFALAPAPGVHFNLGQCYRHLGDMAQALTHYEQYLDQSPDAQNRAAVEALIEQCRLQLAEASDDAGPPDGGDGDAGPDHDAAAVPDAGASVESNDGDLDASSTVEEDDAFDSQLDRFYGESSTSTPDAAATPSGDGGPASPDTDGGVATDDDVGRSRPVYRRWWFWTLIGTAVVGATVGAVVGVMAGEPTVVLPQGSLGTLDGRGQSEK